MVVRMATRTGGAGGYQHWKAYKARGEKNALRRGAQVPAFRGIYGAAKAAAGDG